jgi:hypothetical protein
MRNAYILLFGKHEGKRPLGRTKPRTEDNIKINLKKNLAVGCFGQANKISVFIKCGNLLTS